MCDKQIFNIGTPTNETTIRGMGEQMIEVYKRRWWDGQASMPTFEEVSGEDVYGHGYDDSDRRIPDITKARTLLFWEPKHDLESTLERSMAYWFEGEGADVTATAAQDHAPG